MPEVRKLVIDGLVTLLQANFNLQYALARPTYPYAEICEIDWSPVLGSAPPTLPKNLFIGELDQDQLDQSGLQRFPAVNIFTSEINGASSDRRQKFRKFSGVVTAGMRWYIKHRDGIEQDNIEDTISCIDDATLEAISGDSSAWPAGVVWNGDYKSTPKTRLIGNGYATELSCELTFEVDV